MSEHLMGREELIEVGGKALVTSFAETFEGGGWDEPPRWEDYDEQEHKRFLMAFEAALSAIEGAGFEVVPREPTEAQYDALSATDKMWRHLNSTEVYRAMINAYSPKPSGVEDE